MKELSINTIRRRKSYSDWVDRKNTLKKCGVPQNTLADVLIIIHTIINRLHGYHSALNAKNSKISLEQVIQDFSLEI